MYTLVIGNRNYSSWSLRAWLHLRLSQIPFDEVRISLFSDGWKETIVQYSPAGRVPILLHDDFPVWDSLAIMEYVVEHHANVVGWPPDSARRARARSIVAEMHSGFMAVRDELPQNIRARKPRALSELSDVCKAEIQRINEIWSTCRHEYKGDGEWLFGALSIADIMFAPVALRFVTYSIPVQAPGDEYVRAIQNLEPIKEWSDLSRAEPEAIAPFDSSGGRD